MVELSFSLSPCALGPPFDRILQYEGHTQSNAPQTKSMNRIRGQVNEDGRPPVHVRLAGCHVPANKRPSPCCPA